MINANLIPLNKIMDYVDAMNDEGNIPLCMTHISSSDGPGYILLLSAQSEDLEPAIIQETTEKIQPEPTLDIVQENAIKNTENSKLKNSDILDTYTIKE